jgi:hypothetical protein
MGPFACFQPNSRVQTTVKELNTRVQYCDMVTWLTGEGKSTIFASIVPAKIPADFSYYSDLHLPVWSYNQITELQSEQSSSTNNQQLTFLSLQSAVCCISNSISFIPCRWRVVESRCGLPNWRAAKCDDYLPDKPRPHVIQLTVCELPGKRPVTGEEIRLRGIWKKGIIVGFSLPLILLIFFLVLKQLRLWFAAQSLQLVVSIIGACDLPPKPSGQLRNPYAKLVLLPDRRYLNSHSSWSLSWVLTNQQL